MSLHHDVKSEQQLADTAISSGHTLGELPRGLLSQFVIAKMTQTQTYGLYKWRAMPQ